MAGANLVDGGQPMRLAGKIGIVTAAGPGMGRAGAVPLP
jgi:hypothetical protein